MNSSNPDKKEYREISKYYYNNEDNKYYDLDNIYIMYDTMSKDNNHFKKIDENKINKILNILKILFNRIKKLYGYIFYYNYYIFYKNFINYEKKFTHNYNNNKSNNINYYLIDKKTQREDFTNK